jgi:hypothetical protein
MPKGRALPFDNSSGTSGAFVKQRYVQCNVDSAEKPGVPENLEFFGGSNHLAYLTKTRLRAL